MRLTAPNGEHESPATGHQAARRDPEEVVARLTASNAVTLLHVA
jgi:hypothetical protein